MNVKVRKIGNAIGVIFPKIIVSHANFHAGDTIDVEIDENGVRLKKQNNDLENRIIAGINASEKENIDFSEAFTERETESW